MTEALDGIASVLEGTGEYRLLRRVPPFAEGIDPPNEPTFIGLILDTETTGIDPARDEVIELGIIKFKYGASGRIYRVIETLNQLHQPSKPIPPEVTRLTGITDADVAGQRIDDAAVSAMAADAAVVIAHNASFDRQMCEGRWPIFIEKNWACSCHQVPWRDEGHEGMKLGYLLTNFGFFHNGLRALDDCHALYMPALVATRRNPDLKVKYQALVAAGKPPKLAITAVMRKLLLANALLRDGRTWAPKFA